MVRDYEFEALASGVSFGNYAHSSATSLDWGGWVASRDSTDIAINKSVYFSKRFCS